MQATDETLILDEIHLEETLEAGKLDSYQIRWNKMDHGHPLLFSASPVRYAKFESIRYFIDIDILQNCLIDIDIDIDIFQNHHIDIDIDIDIFGIALSISISISIFSNMTISISISISIFFKSVDISTIDMSYRYIEQG